MSVMVPCPLAELLFLLRINHGSAVSAFLNIYPCICTDAICYDVIVVYPPKCRGRYSYRKVTMIWTARCGRTWATSRMTTKRQDVLCTGLRCSRPTAGRRSRGRSTTLTLLCIAGLSKCLKL
ncbi:hypothetical protein IW262DRAFT_1369133 [Armillaria fumosa]|nr:hypothetical protein IW262DRAFT_1369133 [Armillaria fumosa]